MSAFVATLFGQNCLLVNKSMITASIIYCKASCWLKENGKFKLQTTVHGDVYTTQAQRDTSHPAACPH